MPETGTGWVGKMGTKKRRPFDPVWANGTAWKTCENILFEVVPFLALKKGTTLISWKEYQIRTLHSR